MKPKNKAEPPTDDSASFKEMYPNLVIHDRYKSSIKGLEVWAVYDESQLVEDPIGISHWIVAKGKKFETNNDGVREALKHIKFEPKTEAEALEAALLQFRADEDNVIFMNEPFPPVDAPPEALAKVRMPEVTKESDTYIVSFFTYYCDRYARWTERDYRCVMWHRAEVGKGHFLMQSKEVWSTNPGLLGAFSESDGPSTASKKNEK